MRKAPAETTDETFLLQPEDITGPLDFQSLFGRTCPVEVEIGVGKGRFILSEASRRPDVGFLGIERSRKYILVALDRLNRSGCENVRLLCDDAGFVVRHLIPDGTVCSYHIYFPDPWPKRRHYKRRLFTPQFAWQIRRTLCPSGSVHVATDHAEYFQEIVHSLDSIQDWGGKKIWAEQARDAGCLDATHFEIKYSREGRTVYRLMYKATD